MKKLSMLRMASISPKIKIANTKYNVKELISAASKANNNGADIILFPELTITGSTCGDLFFQELLYINNIDGLKDIMAFSNSIKAGLIVGFFLKINNNFYNCAAYIKGGEILGIIPKMCMTFSEKKWFVSGTDTFDKITSVNLFDNEMPFGNILFNVPHSQFTFRIVIGEDSFTPIKTHSQVFLSDAHIIFNPSASFDTATSSANRRSSILQISKKNGCAYVYASSGVCESSTDSVFSGDCIIACDGEILSKNQRYTFDTSIIYGDVNYDKVNVSEQGANDSKQCSACNCGCSHTKNTDFTDAQILAFSDKLLSSHGKSPFLSEDIKENAEQCQEIFNIQSYGLARRILHTKSQKIIIGISGGLDSTLALLVCVNALKILDRSAEDIIAITMPGFGTTSKTYQNSLTLMKLFQTQMREISIKESVLKHFEDIGHDPGIHDATYENAQARERTQVLMDIANKENGLVIGTGDLSEAALGWCTYNGDHMSMYNVNAGVPKTVIRHVINWFINNRLGSSDVDCPNDVTSSCDLTSDFCYENILLTNTLREILDTPISPELLPPNTNGEISQKTEDTVGPYELHDFFLYYVLKYGMAPEKILGFAKNAFKGEYDEKTIKKWLGVFYKRFFSQQFKRNCSPDGPKVFDISLSPRGGFIMPSDADGGEWV